MMETTLHVFTLLVRFVSGGLLCLKDEVGLRRLTLLWPLLTRVVLLIPLSGLLVLYGEIFFVRTHRCLH